MNNRPSETRGNLTLLNSPLSVSRKRRWASSIKERDHESAKRERKKKEGRIRVDDTWKSEEIRDGRLTIHDCVHTMHRGRSGSSSEIERRGRRKKILNAVSRGCKLCTPMHQTGGQVKVSRKTTYR